VARTREITVPVCEYQPQQRTATRTVYENVAKTREVTVPVCTYEAQEREAVRTRYERVPEQVTRRVQYCEMEAYTETIQVLVNPEEVNGSNGGRRLFGRFR
jgi:hypothetical protein